MSDKQNESQEKSHDATPRKLEQARKKGQMARSTDAQTAMSYLGLATAMFALGGWAAAQIGETLMAFIARPNELAALMTEGAGGDMTLIMMGRIGGAVLPLLALPAALILTLLMAQRAIVIAPDKLKPRLSRISPIENAKQKYGLHGLVEFLKSSIKLLAVATVLGFAVYAELDRLSGYVRMPPRMMPMLLENQLWNILNGVLILSVCIGLADMLWQRHQHLRKMRMSHQELRDEGKHSEGDPHMRQARRERGRAIANNRMLNDVPNADVVIVNPEHYAVALKWNRASGSVPVLVAKGVDQIAQAIRLRAEQAGVPIHSDPPTARSLHALVDVNQPISPEHYKAVAAAIVFADRLRRRERERLRARGY